MSHKDTSITDEFNSLVDKLLEEGDYKHYSEIFTKDDFNPMEFCISPALYSSEGAILKKFQQLIEMHGGFVKFNMGSGGHHIIKLVHSKRTGFHSDDDLFLAQFILDSLKAKKLQNLVDYRATKTKFPEVDPNHIMRGLKSWEDARQTRDAKEEISNVVIDSSDEEAQEETVAYSRPFKRRKKYYSIDEERQILNHIMKRRHYLRVKGNAIWKDMEKIKVCGERTWQSMKERYLNHIIPKIGQFKLSPRVERKVLMPFEKESFSGMKKSLDSTSGHVEETENKSNFQDEKNLSVKDENIEIHEETFEEFVDESEGINHQYVSNETELQNMDKTLCSVDYGNNEETIPIGDRLAQIENDNSNASRVPLQIDESIGTIMNDECLKNSGKSKWRFKRLEKEGTSESKKIILIDLTDDCEENTDENFKFSDSKNSLLVTSEAIKEENIETFEEFFEDSKAIDMNPMIEDLCSIDWEREEETSKIEENNWMPNDSISYLEIEESINDLMNGECLENSSRLDSHLKRFGNKDEKTSYGAVEEERTTTMDPKYKINEEQFVEADHDQSEFGEPSSDNAMGQVYRSNNENERSGSNSELLPDIKCGNIVDETDIPVVPANEKSLSKPVVKEAISNKKVLNASLSKPPINKVIEELASIWDDSDNSLEHETSTGEPQLDIKQDGTGTCHSHLDSQQEIANLVQNYDTGQDISCHKEIQNNEKSLGDTGSKQRLKSRIYKCVVNLNKRVDDVVQSQELGQNSSKPQTSSPKEGNVPQSNSVKDLTASLEDAIQDSDSSIAPVFETAKDSDVSRNLSDEIIPLQIKKNSVKFNEEKRRKYIIMSSESESGKESQSLIKRKRSVKETGNKRLKEQKISEEEELSDGSHTHKKSKRQDKQKYSYSSSSDSEDDKSNKKKREQKISEESDDASYNYKKSNRKKQKKLHISSSDSEDDKSNKKNKEQKISEESSDDSNNYQKSNRKKQKNSHSSSSDSEDDFYSTSKRVNNYTREEDTLILEYIDKRNLHLSVKGKRMWIDMERKKILPGRSWHSLKERFRKRILPALDKYRIPEKLKKKFDNFQKLQTGKKFCVKYSDFEDWQILEYIIQNKRYMEIKGKSMWVSMSRSDPLKSRTWESLKNRFLKNILPNIKSYEISEESLKNFKKAMDKERKPPNWKKYKIPRSKRENSSRMGSKSKLSYKDYPSSSDEDYSLSEGPSSPSKKKKNNLSQCVDTSESDGVVPDSYESSAPEDDDKNLNQTNNVKSRKEIIKSPLKDSEHTSQRQISQDSKQNKNEVKVADGCEESTEQAKSPENTFQKSTIMKRKLFTKMQDIYEKTPCGPQSKKDLWNRENKKSTENIPRQADELVDANCKLPPERMVTPEVTNNTVDFDKENTLEFDSSSISSSAPYRSVSEAEKVSCSSIEKSPESRPLSPAKKRGRPLKPRESEASPKSETVSPVKNRGSSKQLPDLQKSMLTRSKFKKPAKSRNAVVMTTKLRRRVIKKDF